MEKYVLLIDDEAAVRRHISMGLMQQGYNTEPCENGMKGLETLDILMKRKMTPECAIVDVKLPDIDGLKLLRVIKSSYPDLPVVIITGHGNEGIAMEAKSQMAAAYLEKPFDMDELINIIASCATSRPAADSDEAPPEPIQIPAQSTTAYALVSLESDANFLKVYRTLYFQENVVYCDAIRGEHNSIVLLLQADTREAIEAIMDKEIKTIPGIAEVSLLSVEVPTFGENVHNIIGTVDKALGRDKAGEDANADQTARTKVSSYVMLEIEKEKLEAIYPVLYFNDQVVYCDYTHGQYDIVLLMKGASFSEIENTIRTKFKPLDGVLRIKERPILTLFEV
jgi:FixJ family two-component response regulator